jgi:hypothetical protein
MGLRQTLQRASAALLGLSVYDSAPPNVASPKDVEVERARRLYGGQIQLLARTQTRWYMSDLETAELAADAGDLNLAGQLVRACRRDGVISGVLSTRTSGLVRLPKRFRGDAEIIAALEVGHGQVRSAFDEMFPPQELATLAADGEMLGVGFGELVPVQGRQHPKFVRLDPQFLTYRWQENRWYMRSIVGLIPITPGDGRWILHCPGGLNSPWGNGLWKSIGRAYIRKEHAALRKDEWEAKLANPARVAVAPAGAVESQRNDFFSQVMAWGINTVFSLTPGWDVKLIESNGRGYESFCKTIAAQNEEITICIAGQTVTTDGGTGFANADIHKSIRADLIKATADNLAYTINTQGIPVYVATVFGEDAIARSPVVEWDVTPPKDRNAEAQALLTLAQAITQLDAALAPHERELDIAAIANRFGLPILNDVNGDGVPDVQASDDDDGPRMLRRVA